MKSKAKSRFPMSTCIRSNWPSIAGRSARRRSGRRMAKKRQTQWSRRGAHLKLKVRAAILNGDLRQRLACEPQDLNIDPASHG
jgi:hypothetical protein